ncbi:ASCH domain-containing protein [Gracilimonas sediminicola]|uniref:ASCH domain-containing protein n=1 Tax=Gracilimonas sediminicola TaxID=2952158 RepID=UPI0038D50628
MKAISLWQPWASLMQTGAKQVETRSWSTNYRGPLLICSAKKGLSKADLKEQMTYFSFIEGLFPLVRNEFKILGKTTSLEARDKEIEVLPFGKALCVVDLINVVPVEQVRAADYSMNEVFFGDYSEGRYAWITKNRRPIKPVPITGRQGLFNPPEELIENLEYLSIER